MIDKKDILQLRKLTQAPIIDCKKALEESHGDLEKAITWLRKKGQKIAAKKIEKTTDQGAVFAKVNAQKNFGAILLLGSQTDFVARNPMFEELANTLLDIALERQCTTQESLLKEKKEGTSLQEIITQYIAKIGENITINQYATLSDTLISAYIHTGNRLGSLVSLRTSPTPTTLEVAKNIAMQVVATNPLAIDQATMDPTFVAREKLIIQEALQKQGKPQAIAEKIAQGKLSKFFQEHTLLAQPYLKENTQTVLQYLQTIEPQPRITGFKRLMIGTQ